VFPGIGLGAVLSRTRLLTDQMIVAATNAVAEMSSILKDPTAALLPDVSNVREVSITIAKAVIKEAVKADLNQEKDIPEDDTVLEDWIREQMWDARYRPLTKVDVEGASPLAQGRKADHATAARS
jgi:malate dehydrogenase (oxaloacetate-decarboxylating)